MLAAVYCWLPARIFSIPQNIIMIIHFREIIWKRTHSHIPNKKLFFFRTILSSDIMYTWYEYLILCYTWPNAVHIKSSFFFFKHFPGKIMKLNQVQLTAFSDHLFSKIRANFFGSTCKISQQSGFVIIHIIIIVSVIFSRWWTVMDITHFCLHAIFTHSLSQSFTHSFISAIHFQQLKDIFGMRLIQRHFQQLILLFTFQLGNFN